MSSDTLLRPIKSPHDGAVYSYDNIKTQGWLDGHCPGVEAAANYLKDKATVLFQAGKYEEAVAMQNLGKEVMSKILPDLVERARRHEKDYPDVIRRELKMATGREPKQRKRS